MDISLSNAIITEAAQQGGLPAENQAAAAPRAPQPLLGGENVRVGATLTGDLQKLLAQVRAEQEDKKFQLAQQRLSSVLGALCLLSDVSDAQMKQITELQVKIESLEAMIESETTTTADRKKALEMKRRLEADAQKELEAAEASGDEKEIAIAQKRLDDVRYEIAELDAEIADLDTRIADMKRDVGGIGNEITDLLAKFDYPALVLVLAAITVSASDSLPVDDAAKGGEDEESQKIPTPLEIVRESLEKATEDIREEITEKRIATI